jgi:hypothetical protein
MNAAAILASLGDGVVALDRGGNVIYWSAEAERQLLLGSAEVVGMPLPAELGLPGDLEAGEHRLVLRRRDGRELPVLVTAAPLDGGVVMLVKDLLPWLDPGRAGGGELDGDERLGAAIEAILHAAWADLDPAEDLTDLAGRLAGLARRALGQLDCVVALVPPERPEVFRCSGCAGPFAQTVRGRGFRRSGTVIGRALAERRPVESTDMPGDSTYGRLFAGAGVRSIRVVPLLARQPPPAGVRCWAPSPSSAGCRWRSRSRSGG